MVGSIGMLPVFLVAAVALIFGAASPNCWANDDCDEIPFDEAYIYFELNNTDGDLGIHALIDGEPWKRLEIEDPNERRMLGVNVRGRLRRQGLTEFFFESAEPTFDELPPAQFFHRFPEGVYEIEGITLEGDELESEVELTHVMPAPPEVYLTIDGERVEAAKNCDEELPEVEVGVPVIINWELVTESHPALGKPGDIVVHNYEVVVEIDETPWKTSIILPSDVTSFQIPPEILDLVEFEEGEAEVKFEVLVRATSYNQTAIESCFVIIEDAIE
jgi:hypothetical protein